MSYLYPGVENCRALIVDSNHMSRSILAGQLRELGVGTVIQARRPQDARAQLELMPFDFVLCDYHFEHTDYSGQDLLDDLRRSQLLPYSTTFVMVTGEASYNKVAEAAESALDSYLIKPYATNALADRLLLSRRRKTALKHIFDAIEKGNLSGAASLCVQRFMNDESYALYSARIGGELLQRQGMHREAQALYQKLLEKLPKLAWAQLGMARSYFDSQETQKARLMLEKLTREQPEFAEGHDMLGSLQIDQGELDEACAAYQKAWEITPSSITRSVRLGAMNFYVGDKSEAARPLERAAAWGGGSKMFDHQSMVLLAFLRFDDKDSKGVRRCLSSLESALEKMPDQTRLTRMVNIVRITALLAEHKVPAALGRVDSLAEQLDANDLDVEAACNLISLLSRLPEEEARSPIHQEWIEQLTWRFSGNKAATQLMEAASAPLQSQQEQIQSIVKQAQTTVQAALTHALAGERRHTVTELLNLATKWRNAKWAEMAQLALERHRAHIPDADKLEPMIKALRQSITGHPSKLPLGLDTGRQTGGLNLRVAAADVKTPAAAAAVG